MTTAWNRRSTSGWVWSLPLPNWSPDTSTMGHDSSSKSALLVKNLPLLVCIKGIQKMCVKLKGISQFAGRGIIDLNWFDGTWNVAHGSIMFMLSWQYGYGSCFCKLWIFMFVSKKEMTCSFSVSLFCKVYSNWRRLMHVSA